MTPTSCKSLRQAERSSARSYPSRHLGIEPLAVRVQERARGSLLARARVLFSPRRGRRTERTRLVRSYPVEPSTTSAPATTRASNAARTRARLSRRLRADDDGVSTNAAAARRAKRRREHCVGESDDALKTAASSEGFALLGSDSGGAMTAMATNACAFPASALPARAATSATASGRRGVAGRGGRVRGALGRSIGGIRRTEARETASDVARATRRALRARRGRAGKKKPPRSREEGGRRAEAALMETARSRAGALDPRRRIERLGELRGGSGHEFV